MTSNINSFDPAFFPSCIMLTSNKLIGKYLSSQSFKIVLLLLLLLFSSFFP